MNKYTDVFVTKKCFRIKIASGSWWAFPEGHVFLLGDAETECF